MVRMVGAIIGKPEEEHRLAETLLCGLEEIRSEAQKLPRWPRVYFEEWDDPMISGIGWVSEIVEAAGGMDVFADRTTGKSAGDRIVSAGRRCHYPRLEAGPRVKRKRCGGAFQVFKTKSKLASSGATF